MTKCKRCDRATEMWVCKTCVSELRKQLADLPWWIDRLAETAVGQAHLGDRGKRTTRNVLHGDDTLASHIETIPGNGDTEPTEKDHQNRHKAALRHALALGRVNGRAIEELDRIRNTLTTIIRDLCETRGTQPPRLTQARLMAMWIHSHADTVAHHTAGAHICDEIDRISRNIIRHTNRSPEPRILGPCTTDPAPEPVLAERLKATGDLTTRCGYALEAPHAATHVTCPQCAIRHAVNDVQTQNIAERDDELFTIRELVHTILPKLKEPVPQTTLERWITLGWVTAHGTNPVKVKLGDVRNVRSSRPRHARR